MKYCPICDERYDEDIIKFCTRDGTPLIEEGQPKFTALPSEDFEPPDDEIGEDTVIRRNPIRESSPEPYDRPETSERIVIPTMNPQDQQVRPRERVAYYPPPPPPQNNVKTIVLTIIGTLIVLGFGAVLFRMLQSDPVVDMNINTNPPNLNANLNTNLGFDSNFNFNTNANFNTNFNALANFNLNTNIKSPTPTPRPSLSPSPTPSPRDETPTSSPTPRTPANTRPTLSPSPTPRTGPRPPVMTSNRPPTNNE